MNAIPEKDFSNFGKDPVDIMIEESTLDLSKELSAPPVLISIDGQPVATLGNISVIIGKAKSKKTFLVSLFIAATLSKDGLLGIFKASKFPGKTRVISIDTEQARYKVHQIGLKIQRRVGSTDMKFELLSLRSRQVLERLEIIEKLIYSRDDVCLVIIDGIRDLLFDINDPKESSELVGKLMKWSEDRNIHILTVLHQNKGDNNARGHVGTEATNKAETSLSATKDEKNPMLSIVAPEFCREKEFAPFAIGVDHAGMPYVSDEWSAAAKIDKPGKKTPFDFPVTTHDLILKAVFPDGKELRYKELFDSMQIALQSFDIPASEPKIRNFISYYLEKQKWIEKTGVSGSKSAKYKLTELCTGTVVCSPYI